jgi:hypothetical protein
MGVISTNSNVCVHKLCSLCVRVSTCIRKSPVLELAVPVSELAGFLAIFSDF